VSYEVFRLIGDGYPVPPSTPLQVRHFPREGNTVFTAGGRRVRLTSKISEGGEGAVYRTDLDGLVVKIFHPKRLTEDLREKIKAMVKLRSFIKDEDADFALCWPIDVVLNAEGAFVGYLMREARGVPLARMLHPSVLLKKYSHLTRADLVKVAVNALKALDTLYTYSVLMGDVNGLNFLVDEKTLKVYLIDADSWQIGPFTCKVGRPEYCHPDWLEGRFENRPREPRSEAFAVAILVFMTLLPGKHPFSQVGGEGTKENIRARNFPYVVKSAGITRYENAPVGHWIFIWSHTPPRIRELLYTVLVGEWEPRTYEELRWYVNELIKALERYRSEILGGMRTNSLFPNYYFIPDSVPKTLLTCPSCGKPFEISNDPLNNLSTNEVVCPYCYKLRRLAKSLSRLKYTARRAQQKVITVPTSPPGLVRPTIQKTRQQLPQRTPRPAYRPPAPQRQVVVNFGWTRNRKALFVKIVVLLAAAIFLLVAFFK